MNIKQLKTINQTALELKKEITNSKSPLEGREIAREYRDSIATLEKYRPLFNISLNNFMKYFNEFFILQSNTFDGKCKLIAQPQGVKATSEKYDLVTSVYSCLYQIQLPNNVVLDFAEGAFYYSTAKKDNATLQSENSADQTLQSTSNSVAFSSKLLSADKWLEKDTLKNTKINLLSNKYLHIPSVYNVEDNKAEFDAHNQILNEALWYVAKENIFAQRDAKLDDIKAQKQALNAEKAELKDDDTMLENLIRTY